MLNKKITENKCEGLSSIVTSTQMKFLFVLISLWSSSFKFIEGKQKWKKKEIGVVLM